MPGDVLGANIFDFDKRAFTLTKGPIFTDILLGMKSTCVCRKPGRPVAGRRERQATIDGVIMNWGFFTVIATQNPIEQQGTYPLPGGSTVGSVFLLKVVLIL